MENDAEDRAAAVRAEVEALDRKVTGLMVVEPSRFEQRPLAPGKGDVKILRYDVVWIH
jgi:hypothetical protein